MVSTFSVMAASLLLGQATDVPAGPASPPSGKVYVYNNGQLVPYNGTQGPGLFGAPSGTISGTTTGTVSGTEPRRPFLSRIQGWFGKRNGNNGGTINTIETAPPPLIAPSPSPGQGSTIAPTMPPAAAPAAQVPGEFPRKMPTSIKAPTSSNESRTIPTSEAISPAALTSLPAPAKTPILPTNANRIGRDEKFEWITGQLEIEKGQYVLYYATPETVDPHHGRIVLSPQKVDLRGFHSGDLISVRGRVSTGHLSTVYQLSSADLIESAKK